MLVRYLRDFHGRSDNDPAGMSRYYKRGSVEHTPDDLARIAVEAGYAVAVDGFKNLGDAPQNKALGGAPASKFPDAVDKTTDSGTRRGGRKPAGVTRATMPRSGRKISRRK